MKKTAPRLHVIPAIACDKALVLRRGPKDAVASLLWNRHDNTFELGQWLKGRVYEHRCDLTPDARHMIVFARKTDASLAWTTLSRAPWLRALQFYPQEHTWHGGGAFDADGRVWLNGTLPPAIPVPDGLKPADTATFPHATDGFHMGNLYAAKMMMRGWAHKSGKGYDMLMTKPLKHGWVLELSIRLRAKNRSIISDKFAVVHDGKGLRHEQPHWEWADPHDGTVQFAERGALHQAKLTPDGDIENRQMIRDFSDMTFRAMDAPYEGVSTQVYAQ